MTLEELQAGIVIPIDKPRQWTSFQAVNKVKSIIRHHFDLKKFKIGHAGTLDPLATGLLLICVGRATKRIEELQSGIKTYTGTMVLGATTPCYDLEQAVNHYFPYQHISLELIEKVKTQFVGDIEQVPPIFSAVKIDGQRAYSLARSDNQSDASPSPKMVHIEEFVITNFRPGTDGDMSTAELTMPTPSNLHHLYDNPQGSIPKHLPQIDFRITCSKGTYIRSIARDFGLALDSGAFLASLRRERIGDYAISQSFQLECLAETFFANKS